MKHHFGFRIPFLFAAAVTILPVFFLIAFCLAFATPSLAQSGQITLLHISDTHSHLAAWGPKDANLDGTLGGLPKAAMLITTEKAADPKAVLVHAGDYMDGDLFFAQYMGVPELQILKSIGLDALVLGNHDFAFGPDFQLLILQSAWYDGDLPILGTNLDPTGHPLGSWLTPTMLRDIDGVKVGFFGLLTPNGALARPKPVKILPYLDTIAPNAVAGLRAAGAQVVVCVAHIGMAESRQLAQSVPGIDVIVNGHDNAVLQQPEQVENSGGTTFIVSAGNYYRWVGRLRLAVDGSRVHLVDYKLLSADAGAPSLPPVQTIIDNLKGPIVTRFGDVYHQPLAWAEQDITATWNPRKAKRDTPLGNLFTDAYRASTGTDIAVEALGFLGDPLPAGTIVGADVFRAMSYVMPAQGGANPWRLITFRATGSGILDALDLTIYFGGDYFPQVSGLRMDYDSSIAGTHKILRNTARVHGHLVLADQLYTVTVTEGVYVALQKLGLNMQDVQVLPTSAFDAARILVTQRGDLGLAASNRIRDIAVLRH